MLLDNNNKAYRTGYLRRLYNKRATEKQTIELKTDFIQQKQISKTLLEPYDSSLQCFWTNLKTEVTARGWTHLFIIKKVEDKHTTRIDYLTKPTIMNEHEIEAYNETHHVKTKLHARIRKNLYIAIHNTLSTSLKNILLSSNMNTSDGVVLLAAWVFNTFSIKPE